MAKKARVVLDTTRAQPATGAAKAEGASAAKAAAAAAKAELKGTGTGKRGRRVTATTEAQAGEATTQQPAAQPANAQSALISLLTKAKDAGDTMNDPNYLKEQISKYQVLYPDMGADEFLAALTKVDPTGVNQGAYNYLQPEAEAVGGEGGDAPPPPPPSAVADSGTQTNLQEGVVTSSDESLPPVTDEQGELTGEQIAARLQGMVGDATTNAPVAVTSTKFGPYGGTPPVMPRRAVQPTAEQAAANVAGEAAAADAEAAAADRLTEDDLRQIVGDIELDESVVVPPPPYQPDMPVPPEAQLGPRTEPAVPYTMQPIDVANSLPLARQPLDLSGLTQPADVQSNLMGMPEGSEPVDVQAYLKALLTDKNIADQPIGSARMFNPVTANLDGLTRSTPMEQFAVGAFQPSNAQFKGTSPSSTIVFDSRTPRSSGSAEVAPAPQEPPRVPVSSIRRLIEAARANPTNTAIIAGGAAGAGLLGLAANQKPPEPAQPVVNLSDEERELISRDPAAAIENMRKRNAARNTGAGGLMTNVMEDRP